MVCPLTDPLEELIAALEADGFVHLFEARDKGPLTCGKPHVEAAVHRLTLWMDLP
jgi:hypothetical protein